MTFELTPEGTRNGRGSWGNNLSKDPEAGLGLAHLRNRKFKSRSFVLRDYMWKLFSFLIFEKWRSSYILGSTVRINETIVRRHSTARHTVDMYQKQFLLPLCDPVQWPHSA